MAQVASPAFAVQQDYGPAFTNTKDTALPTVKGDLSGAGLQGQGSFRKAMPTFHGLSYFDYTANDVNFKPVNPSKSSTIDGSAMTTAATYNLVKNGPNDNLHTATNGFFAMPVTEVPRYVASAKGNPQFVMSKLLAAHYKLQASGTATGSVSYDGVTWRFYTVSNILYVDVPSVIWESAGTNLASDRKGAEKVLDYVGGDGVNTPQWWATFPTTVAPTIETYAPVILGQHVDYSTGNVKIPPMSQSDYIDFSGTTWGFLRNTATLTLWTSPGKPKKLWSPGNGPASIGPMKAGKWAGVDTVPGKIYLRDIQDILLPGKNVVTVKLDDAFGRSVTKSLVIMYQPKNNLWAKNIWYAPATVKSGAKVTISAELGSDMGDTASALQVYVDKNGNGKLDPSDIIAAPSNITIEANGTRTAGYSFFAPTDKQQILVAFKVNPGKTKPDNESDWKDNLVAKEIPIEMPWVTPPIDVNNIDYNNATPYWASVAQPQRLDRYIVDCGTINGPLSQKYVGKDRNFRLTGLSPGTTYKCQIQAISVTNQIGGTKSTTFTTPDIPANTGSGYWDDYGIVRENPTPHGTAQSINSIPARGYNYYQGAPQNMRSMANSYSPYFGEEVSTWAKPVIKTTWHTWKFYYTCGKRTCVGTDSCPIYFPGAAPEAWAGIRQNPSGLTINVTGSWTGSTSKMAVTDYQMKPCRGSNSLDPTPFQFNYYVPTMYRAVPNLLINKGFIPQTQTIDPTFQHMNLKIYSKAISIDRNANMSGTSITSPVPFSMLWSRYGTFSSGR
ncbi:hypothetical protein PP175_21715 [Aneurinibacillus sp. Ricciae_BoGa-3]|uniref:hypothetical protein n=1 Tax=Aneurinibacillus sp. Ricciae_BoGa-3 TaxID=3022697 RepID=UPI00233FAEA1|nr:hypothetical protein [Aneurinibacillus sp. Ricciae_BoGa-3]WCK53909.1 hypothetical protein PP175_21715 [Aneurinibacillus sp. Ricciae_BoGa-3]